VTTDPDRLYWDEFVSRGIELREKADGVQWELGALALTVETTYGARDFQKFADAIGIGFLTLQDYRYVVSRFSGRPDNLPIGVLRALSAKDNREELLKRAVAEKWTVKRAREEANPPAEVKGTRQEFEERQAQSKIKKLGKGWKPPSVETLMHDFNDLFDRFDAEIEKAEGEWTAYIPHEHRRLVERTFERGLDIFQGGYEQLQKPQERPEFDEWQSA